MLKFSAFLAGLFLALPALATCEGENLYEALSVEEKAALDARLADTPYPEGNLWRAERDGSTVHVVGTLHLADPRHEVMISRLEPVLDHTDLVILESSMETEAEMANLVMTRPDVAIITEGPSLIEQLGDEDWNRLKPLLLARGVPPFIAAKMQPWLVAMTLAIPACAIQHMAEGALGLDGQIEKLAQRQGIDLATLDVLEDVLNMLATASPDEQLSLLRASIMPEEDVNDMHTTLNALYFDGRHRLLMEISRALSEEMGEEDGFRIMEDDLLKGRNEKWAPKIADLVDGKDAILAVGAAHLSGETGVLKQLENLGYNLTRL